MADALTVEKPLVLDLLDTTEPKTSSTNDLPVVETKPDSTPVAPEKVVQTEADKEGEAAAPTEDSSAAPDEVKKPAKGVQKRIDELTRQREDERRLREAAEARELRILSALERAQAGDKPKDASVEDKEPVKPLKNAFENPEDYDAAVAEYVVNKAAFIARQEVKAQREEDRRVQEVEKQRAQARTAQEAFQSRVQKAKEKYADFSEVAENPNVQVSMPMVYAISSYEQGPDIQYYLGKNPAEAERIRNLQIQDPSGEMVPDVARQLVELGKIAYRLENPAQVVTKPVSAAPAPIKPTKTGETATKTPEEMTMEEYAAYRKPSLVRRPGERLN